jgi:8-oxo-dGTP pyrophosphatase MutT (NUDIX family)
VRVSQAPEPRRAEPEAEAGRSEPRAHGSHATPSALTARPTPLDQPRAEPWPLAARVELIQDVSRISLATEGYLKRYRQRVKTVFTDGTRSEVYVVDYVDRGLDRRDAVGFVLWARAASGQVADTRILLRRQLRYAAYVAAGRPLMTELYAGLIEGGEAPEACVLRECWEEAAVETTTGHIMRLGRPFFPVPGLFTERIVPLAVEVDDATYDQVVARPPPGDGSPFEEGSVSVAMTLGEAFAMIEAAEPGDPAEPTLDDAKTEIVLARLWRWLEEHRA